MTARTFTTSILATALAAAMTLPATAAPLAPSVTTSLNAIKKDADGVAAGRYKGTSLRGPARRIALRWSTIAGGLFRNPEILVESRMANRSITTFEGDWKHRKDARASARVVSRRISELEAATKS